MLTLLELAPFFLLALAIVLWPGASARLIEAIVDTPTAPRGARRRAASRRPRSETDRGRILASLKGARAPPVGISPASA